MDISNLNKAQILAALYNDAKPVGMGFLQYDPAPMTEKEAQEILDLGSTYFDYLKGRVMKIDLCGDELETHLYNRDNGEGGAEEIIEKLKRDQA